MRLALLLLSLTAVNLLAQPVPSNALPQDTPATRRVIELVKIINLSDSAATRAYVQDNYAASFLS